ncbi:O-antigen ligase family protein [Listeria fleischmannii]|uniref:Lipid A core - O-antigen ligase and related enzymes n=2 Tax=Listeria fleischmannii TaxID=1069827 RepID=A0A2X3GQ06_9LIST|nr:O-antigen ligase family protein [Listeria fleischmannii]EMG27654.1 hypothetical protein LFLEISCH_09834 [Listeria fleischmannii subsp. fleischmannii LU2006-1]SQC70458.1 Uncharacterised protein [Listeria fleischmannii subsp. fleischmannii]
MSSKLTNVYIFIILFSMFPIIDFLNGLFISSGISLPIGMLYRMFCFFYLVVGILYAGFEKNLYTLVTVFFIFTILLILFLQAVVLQNSVAVMSKDIEVFIKFFLWVMIAYFIYQRRKDFLKINYDSIFIAISAFFTLGLLIPYVLGLGNQTYENSDAGYKGFFFATNDTTIALMISATFTGWSFMKALVAKKKLKATSLAALYLGTLICLIILGTKTGILYGVLLTVGILINFLVSQKTVKLSSRLITFAVAVVALIILVVVGKDFIVSAVSGTYDRITYFYRLYNGDLVRLLTSSRSDFLQAGFQEFVSKENSFMIPIIGFGFEYRTIHFGRMGLIEMDFFDGLFALGFLGVFVTTAIIVYFLVLSLRKGNRNIYSLAYFVFLFYSFSAGHVMFSALSSTLLGLVCGGLILSREKWLNKHHVQQEKTTKETVQTFKTHHFEAKRKREVVYSCKK